MSKKRGKLSLDEEKFITENADKQPIEKIAEYLNRTVEPVKRFINENALISSSMSEKEAALTTLKERLRMRPFWSDVQEQLTTEEIRRFEDNWVNIILQFREDVMYTEELQIRDLLILQILINRSMKDRKAHIEDANRIQVLLEKEYAKGEDDRDIMAISNLEQQLGISRAAVGSYNTEHMKLLGEIKHITKSLKATREERIQRIEDSKSSWVGYLKMLEDEELRERQGIDLVIMDKAKDKAVQDLAEWHQYEDGTIDQPFLTAETVKDDDFQNNNIGEETNE